MQPGEIGYLVLLGLVFAIWAFVWFRALFGLKRIADQRRREAGIGYFAGIGITIAVFGAFLWEPAHRPRRRQVLFWTLVLFALILLRLWTLPG